MDKSDFIIAGANGHFELWWKRPEKHYLANYDGYMGWYESENDAEEQRDLIIKEGRIS